MPAGLSPPFRPLPDSGVSLNLCAMMRYFDIHDRARLPQRFYGETLCVTARG